LSLDSNKEQYRHCFVRSEAWYELNGRIFMAMEFMPLGDLQTNLQGKPLSEFKGRQITEQVLEAVGFMHSSEFLHQDLKPAVCLSGENLATFLTGL